MKKIISYIGKILLILVVIGFIWLLYGLNRYQINGGKELLANEKKYEKILELVKNNFYEPKENCNHMYVYIYNEKYNKKIYIKWVNSNQIEDTVYFEDSKSLNDYAPLKEAIEDVLGANFLSLYFAFDQNGAMAAKFPYKQEWYNKKDIEDGSYYKKADTYSLYYMENGFLQEEFSDIWICFFYEFFWKKEWGY